MIQTCISDTTHDGSCHISYAAYMLEEEAQSLGFTNFKIGGTITLYSHDGSCDLGYAGFYLQNKAQSLGFKKFTVLAVSF